MTKRRHRRIHDDEIEYTSRHLLELGPSLDRDHEKIAGEHASIWLARRLLRVRDRAGNITPLEANAAQLAFETARGRHNIVVKARQMGLTTWIAGRFFLKTITARGVLTVQVAQTREAAESIFRIVQRFWDRLPAGLREGPLRRSRANVGQMIFPALDSEFRVLSAADGNAGRGLTIHNLHLSEVSRWPGDAAETLAGLRAALVPTGELAMESTPNGAYGCFYGEWRQAERKHVVRHFLPWWLEPAYVANIAANFTAEEQALVDRHGLTAAQIGFRRNLERSYRGLRTQEFAEDAELCFRTTGDCCFDLDAIEVRMPALPSPAEKRRGGALEIWLPPLAGRSYLVAVDTAGGGSDGDYAAVQVIDLITGAQCAELQQHVSLLELAHVAASLAREYNGALLAVERNNHGAGVLAYLDAVEHYPRVYEKAGVTGWLTSAASKPAMVSRMGALLAESPVLFSSKRLLEECRTFVSLPGGRTGAAAGSHDDCIMAMALAHAVRAEWLGTAGRSRAV